MSKVEHSVKNSARRSVRTAIENGSVSVPKCCQRCGTRRREFSDGRRSLQAHHEDYSNPLVVVWVCEKCHNRLTEHATGEQNGASKLTCVQVEAIRQLHQDGWNNGKIACAFGVYHATIHRVVNDVSWIAEKRRTEGA